MIPKPPPTPPPPLPDPTVSDGKWGILAAATVQHREAQPRHAQFLQCSARQAAAATCFCWALLALLHPHQGRPLARCVSGSFHPASAPL